MKSFIIMLCDLFNLHYFYQYQLSIHLPTQFLESLHAFSSHRQVAPEPRRGRHLPGSGCGVPSATHEPQWPVATFLPNVEIAKMRWTNSVLKMSTKIVFLYNWRLLTSSRPGLVVFHINSCSFSAISHESPLHPKCSDDIFNLKFSILFKGR